MAEGATDRVTFLPAEDHNLRALSRRAGLGPYRLQAGDTGRRRATFLDTADLALTRYGATVRLSRQSGRWQATLTWTRQADGLAYGPEVLTVALPHVPRMPFVVPAGKLRLQLCALLAGRPLHPILILEVRRRRLAAWGPAGVAHEEPIAELLLERVRVFAPEDAPRAPARGAYEQLTVQRRGGQRRDLTRLLRLLRVTYNLRGADTSAVARGLTLVGRDVPPPPADPRVLADDSVQKAAQKTVARHLGRLRAHDPGTRIGDDPEALHNLRVAVRRLRAAVRVFAPGFSPALREYLTAELPWLGQITGAVRDLDVQLARLRDYGGAFPAGHRAGLAPLWTYMETERTRRRAEMLAGLDSRRYLQLLLRLEAFALGRVHTPARDAAAHEAVAQAGAHNITRAWRRLLKRGNSITGTPAPEDLHALRIRAKRLRYLLEFLQELTGKRGRRLVKRLVALQDLLGAYHDAVVTAEFVRQYAEGPGAHLGAAGLLTLGALANTALRVADDRCREFQHTWHRFSRKRTRKELSALVDQLTAVGSRTPIHSLNPTPRRLSLVTAPPPQRRTAREDRQGDKAV